MPFNTIVTTAGQAKIATAISSGIPLQLLQMAVGDGNGNPTTPSAGQTALVRQRYIGPISNAKVDPNTPSKMIFDLQIPMSQGGWTIHEVGLFDNTGTLIAVANFPATYKPLETEGAAADLTVRISIQVGNSSAVTVTVDPAIVLASQQWVIDNFSLAALAPGGTSDQVLVKNSNAPGDVEWRDPFQLQVIVDVRKEQQTLTAGQTIVDLAICTTVGLAVYIEGAREEGFTINTTTRITLDQSYPTGTKIYFYQNDPTNQADLLTRNGGTMLPGASIAFNGGGITGLPAPAVPSAPATKGYVDAITSAAKLVGEIFMHGGNPVGTGGVEYMPCDGRRLDRTAYADLFTALGGASSPWGLPDGTGFNIPDLEGRGPIGSGDGSGLTARTTGQKGGSETHTLSVAEMPAHDHSIRVNRAADNSSWQNGPLSDVGQGWTSTARTTSEPIGDTGGGLPHNNMQPFTVVNFYIRAK